MLTRFLQTICRRSVRFRFDMELLVQRCRFDGCRSCCFATASAVLDRQLPRMGFECDIPGLAHWSEHRFGQSLWRDGILAEFSQSRHDRRTSQFILPNERLSLTYNSRSSSYSASPSTAAVTRPASTSVRRIFTPATRHSLVVLVVSHQSS
jgi:hypothetical protein